MQFCLSFIQRSFKIYNCYIQFKTLLFREEKTISRLPLLSNFTYQLHLARIKCNDKLKSTKRILTLVRNCVKINNFSFNSIKILVPSALWNLYVFY